MQISLSESGAPLLIQSRVRKWRVWPKQRFFSVTSEEAGAGGVEGGLFIIKAIL